MILLTLMHISAFFCGDFIFPTAGFMLLQCLWNMLYRMTSSKIPLKLASSLFFFVCLFFVVVFFLINEDVGLGRYLTNVYLSYIII